MKLRDQVRARVIMAAQAEAQRRGDRRLGTEHLLLGVLHEPEAVEALGVDLAAARAALHELDRQALAAVGLDVGDFLPTTVPAETKRPPLTTGARATLLKAIKPEGKVRHPEARHFVLALLACQRPDPAADLLARLDVDTEAVRARLRP